MGRGSGRAQKCYQVVPGLKGGVVQCNRVISTQMRTFQSTEFTLDFHCRLYFVLWCCLCRNSSTFSQGCCNPVSAVFHNFDLLLGFERLFGAVHTWLVGNSPARRSVLPLM